MSRPGVQMMGIAWELGRIYGFKTPVCFIASNLDNIIMKETKGERQNGRPLLGLLYRSSVSPHRFPS